MLLTGASYIDKRSKYIVTLSNQTYLPIATLCAGQRRFSDKLLSDFWSISPKNDDCWPRISSILLNGASYNEKNQPKYISTSSNQTYLHITTHFASHKRFSGKLLSDFWSPSSKNNDFWPQISSILLTGASYNDKKQSKYFFTSSNQTYLSITTHFVDHMGTLW